MTVPLPLTRRLASLVKPRIVGLLCLTGASGLLAAGGASPVRAVGFLVSGALVAGGAAALNCWYDRDIDRHMERTADRPLPSGDLAPAAAFAFAVGLLAVGTGLGLAVLPPVAVGYMWLGVLAYAGLYTVLLKRRSRLGVVLGGSAGAFPVLAGWTAVRPLAPAAILMAAVVFVWTPAHAWALAFIYRDDFAAADVPTLPAVSSPEQTARAVWYAAVATVAIVAAAVPFAGPTYAATALVGSPLFLLVYGQYRRTGTERDAVQAFFTSNCYLAVLFLGWAAGGLTPASASVIPFAAGVLVPLVFAGVWASGPSLRGIEAASVLDSEVRKRLETALLWGGLTNVFGESSSGAEGVRDEREPHSEALE